MSLGPKFLVTVFVLVTDGLDGGPAQYSVVAYEGRDVAVADGVFDRGVDEVGEEGDAYTTINSAFELGCEDLPFSK